MEKSMIEVVYDSNNSGGGWWLTDQNWIDLFDAGWSLKHHYDNCRYSDNGRATLDDEGHNWNLDPRKAIAEDDRWLGGITKSARKYFASMKDAIREWEDITGQSASDEGCNCCGQPHEFSGKNVETGEYISGPTIEASYSLVWDDE